MRSTPLTPPPHDDAGRAAVSGRLDLTAVAYSRSVERRTPAGVRDTVSDAGAVVPASDPNVFRLIGGEPSTVQQWDATHVLVITSWSRTMWKHT